MAILRMYRSTGYNWLDKDPVIDEVRTILQDEGLIKKLQIVHELSNVSVSTMANWFDGDTKRPQNTTVDAVLASLGYERKAVKISTLDFEKERKKAQRWREQQEEKATPRRRRINGSARRSPS